MQGERLYAFVLREKNIIFFCTPILYANILKKEELEVYTYCFKILLATIRRDSHWLCAKCLLFILLK